MCMFNSDYNEGAHENIIRRLAETNYEQTTGYGEDVYCQQAADKIRNACAAPNADVHFLVGGTQANVTVIASALKPYQGVLSAQTGHINVHETGAVEAAGHKVLVLAENGGKISAEQVRAYCAQHYADDSFEHTVQPKMVYISHPTEFGTIYTKAELEELRKACDEYELYLFLDGARLAYGLTAEGTDVTLPDLAGLCDVFYIGGTKVGALFGEAVVITNPTLQKDFRYNIKQRGGMLAKGRLLGLQFDELFSNDLYCQMGRHANQLAMKVKEIFRQAGCKFFVESPTNQQFVIVPNNVLKKLSEKYVYTYSGAYDENSSIARFCTSWATLPLAVQELEQDLQQIMGMQ